MHYPELNSDVSRSDFGWPAEIGKNISASNGDVILAGHSLGASMIVKYLSEHSAGKKITGVFLMAAPFWSGNEDWKQGLKLKKSFATHLPANIPFFFYHCRDDEEVPFSQLNQYVQTIPQAVFRELDKGGHLFNNQITTVAKDIRTL